MKEFELNFENQPLPRCQHCSKEKGHHKAKTLECPTGRKHRTFGYTSFATTFWTPKVKEP